VKKIQKKIQEAKKALKDNKEELIIGAAIGVPTAVASVLLYERISMNVASRAMAKKFAEGFVYEKLLSTGDTFKAMVVKAGEEAVEKVCSCEHP
jgi:uncharacterized membrane protein